jgi:integrase
MGRTTGVNLTQDYIKGLETRVGIYRIPDVTVRGLEIQIAPSGTKSWVVRYRFHGRQRTLTLGRWDRLPVVQARKDAIKRLGELHNGTDPLDKRKAERNGKRVSDLVEKFIEKHVPTLKKNSRTQYLRLLNSHVLPTLGTRLIKDVQPSDIDGMLTKIRERTAKGIEANRTCTVVSKMYKLAALWGMHTGPNPALGQTRSLEKKRERFLTDREIIHLGVVLKALDPSSQGSGYNLGEEDLHALAAIRLYLLTGMRKSELIGDTENDIPGLIWPWVNLRDKEIRLDEHKTDRSSGVRIVHLCDEAVDLLRSLPRIKGNPHVIPGRMLGESLVGLPKIWDRIREASVSLQKKTKVPVKARLNISDVTIHDLRRSFSSLAARLQYSELIIAGLLGHAAETVTAGYARVGPDPLKVVVDHIGGRMAALLDGKVDLEAEAVKAKAAAKQRILQA